MIRYFSNWCFFMLVIYVNSHLNRRSEGEGRELPPTTVGGSSLPFSPLLQLSRDSLMQYSKIEILIKTFILDSHRPFIYSVG